VNTGTYAQFLDPGYSGSQVNGAGSNPTVFNGLANAGQGFQIYGGLGSSVDRSTATQVRITGLTVNDGSNVGIDIQSPNTASTGCRIFFSTGGVSATTTTITYDLNALVPGAGDMFGQSGANSATACTPANIALVMSTITQIDVRVFKTTVPTDPLPTLSITSVDTN
jgi:hypothetical protein